MPNKGWDQLNPLDQLLRRTAGIDMSSGVKVRIEMINGFELYNTRPYHNYETWSDGYRVSGLGVQFESEDLDDAIQGWAKLATSKYEVHGLALKIDGKFVSGQVSDLDHRKKLEEKK